MLHPIVFVSSPYTHPEVAVVQSRVDDVTAYTAHLLNNGVQAFSPIVYGHVIATAHNLPGDWNFWQAFCETYLLRAEVMHILCIPGWSESVGIRGEIECAKNANIPVVYIDSVTYKPFEAMDPDYKVGDIKV